MMVDESFAPPHPMCLRVTWSGSIPRSFATAESSLMVIGRPLGGNGEGEVVVVVVVVVAVVVVVVEDGNK